ncbi:MAG TPA: Yip1 family protein [Usitatibacter sp.]|nr:Yip1 family protein [Usitatibacter sp.]
MNLVERAKNIILKPKQEWPVIAAEPHTVQGLYTQYVMILAAIPAVAAFIGFSVLGMGGLGTSYRMPMGAGVAHMVVSYVLSLGMVYVLALIIDGLAPTFGGQKNFMQAFKVAAFSPTASWIAGIFYIVPALGILAVIGGLYSLYLLYTGLAPLMKAPEEKSIAYTVVVIIAAIVLTVVIAALSALVLPGPVRGF